MYPLSLLTVDLKIAKEKLLSVFEIADSIDSQPKNSYGSAGLSHIPDINYLATILLSLRHKKTFVFEQAATVQRFVRSSNSSR